MSAGTSYDTDAPDSEARTHRDSPVRELAETGEPPDDDEGHSIDSAAIPARGTE